MMAHDIMEWVLMVGLVLEQPPTHKKFMSPWWMENKMVNIAKCIKENLIAVLMKMFQDLRRALSGSLILPLLRC